MITITIDCRHIESEAAFWEHYLRVSKADGARYFGRNLDAFRDALDGGPGWPGECELHFTNTELLLAISGGTFLQVLRKIAAESTIVKIRL